MSNSIIQDHEKYTNRGSHSGIRGSTTGKPGGDGTITVKPSSKPKQKYLHCVSCSSPFSNAWDLMVHVQTAHMMNIYQLADGNKLQQQVNNNFI